MTTQTLTIPGRLPSLNDVTRANRTNRYAGAKQKRDLEVLIGWEVVRQRMKRMTGPVHVSIAWYEGDRRRDPDNITSSVKFVLDALVNTGVLAGDSQRYVATVDQHLCYDPARPRVEVTLEEVA